MPLTDLDNYLTAPHDDPREADGDGAEPAAGESTPFDVDRSQKYNIRLSVLEKLSCLENRVETLREWVDDRIEQHEVFGDEVGTNTDYEHLLLTRRVLTEVSEHLEWCGDHEDYEE